MSSTRPYQIDPFSPTLAMRKGKLAFSFSTNLFTIELTASGKPVISSAMSPSLGAHWRPAQRALDQVREVGTAGFVLDRASHRAVMREPRQHIGEGRPL